MGPALDLPTLERLTELAVDLHNEALDCAKAGAYRAGCVTIGSALEAALLVTTVVFEDEIKARGLWPKGKPLDWGLRELIPVATQARWFPERFPGTEAKFVELAKAELGDALRWVKWLRNLVHPGAYVREMPPSLHFGETVFQNAFEVLDGAFTVTAVLLDRAAPGGIDPGS